MTISQTQLDQELSEPEIKKFWLGYFQENFREAIHQDLLERYQYLRDTRGLSRSDLAKKIGRRPEQVTRWLSSPTNLEVDSISDMGLGLGVIPKLSFLPVESLFVAATPNQGNQISDFVGASNAPSKASSATSSATFKITLEPQDDAYRKAS